MKPIIHLFLFIFLFSFIDAKAQQPHFIYIQTENKQPFYVKMDKTIYSSSESGYVIISKLLDSTYNFTIGFLKNEWPQQNFTCTINKKDEGYVLKNFGDKGWALFNLESMDVVMANVPAQEKKVVKEERTDSFSNMLAVVVNDPGIKQKQIVKAEVKKDTSAQSLVNKDTIKTQLVTTAKPTEVIVKSIVTKLLQNTNNGGIELVYQDDVGDNKDTIRLFIPADKIELAPQPVSAEKTKIDTVQKQSVVEENKPVAEIQKSVTVNSNDSTPKTAASPKARLDSTNPGITPVEANISVQPGVKTTVTANSNGCPHFATDEDFLKLRKKMASAEADDDMISIAKKVFKLKCFVTKQIRNLGFLFLKDEGRYKFFDMAYSFVSDPENFDSLQNQLTDAYYINRFKVMLKH